MFSRLKAGIGSTFTEAVLMNPDNSILYAKIGAYLPAGFAMAHGHPQAAPADANTCDPGHGGWYMTRTVRP